MYPQFSPRVWLHVIHIQSLDLNTCTQLLVVTVPLAFYIHNNSNCAIKYISHYQAGPCTIVVLQFCSLHYLISSFVSFLPPARLCGYPAFPNYTLPSLNTCFLWVCTLDVCLCWHAPLCPSTICVVLQCLTCICEWPVTTLFPPFSSVKQRSGARKALRLTKVWWKLLTM